MLLDCLFLVNDFPTGSLVHQTLISETEDFARLEKEIKALVQVPYMLHYQDDEGDRIRISTDQEASEAFAIAKQAGGTITFFVTPAPTVTDTMDVSADVSAPAAVEAEEAQTASATSADADEAAVHLKHVGDHSELLAHWKDLGNSPNKSVDLGEVLASLKDTDLSKPLAAAIDGNMVESIECWVEGSNGEVLDNVTFQADEPSVKVEEKSVPVPNAFDTIHRGVACDKCDVTIRGVRYKCANCEDYDLCANCEATNMADGTHDAEHIFFKIYKPVSMPFRARRSYYNRPNGGCPRFNRGGEGRGGKCHGKWRKRREEVDNKIQSLENTCAALAEQVEALRAERVAGKKVADAEAAAAAAAHEEQKVRGAQRAAQLLANVMAKANEEEEKEAQLPEPLEPEPYQPSEPVVAEPLVEEPEEEPVVIQKEPIVELAREPSVVIEEVDPDVVMDDAEQEEEIAPREPSLLESSMAGLSPEYLVVFDCLVNMGFGDYERNAELIRLHQGNVERVIAELLK